MRRIISYTFLSLVLLASCKKSDKYVFSEPPQQREAEVLTALDSQLNSGDGWVANLYTKLYTQGFSFYMQFKDNSRVIMLSDIDTATMVAPYESGYRLSWLEQPSILFDTWNYIHRLSDPMPDNEGGSAGVNGDPGTGLISDFEFGLTATTIDSLKNYPDKLTELITVGRNNGLNVTFRKASADEAAFWQQGKMKSYVQAVNGYWSGMGLTSFPLIEIAPGQFIQISFYDKTATIYTPVGSTDFTTQTTGYAFGVNQIVLEDTISIGGIRFNTLTWDGTNLSVVAIGATAVPLQAGPTVLPALSVLIGNKYFFDIVNMPSPVPAGTSSDFTARRTSANSALLAGIYQLTLGLMDFKFNASATQMILNTVVYQNGTGYLAQFPYTYTVDGSNLFKFSINGSNMDATTIAIYNYMAPLLAQRITADHFALNYVNNNGAVYGQFRSIEHPTFTFSGLLQ